jgi:hypothetical protein
MATAGAYSSDSYALDFLPSITNNYDTSYLLGTTSSAGATSIPTTQAVHGICQRGNSLVGWRNSPALNPKMRRALSGLPVC